MQPFRPFVGRPGLVVTPFRTLRINRYRERRISLTEAEGGKAVRVDTYMTEDGRPVAGSLCILARDLPAFLAALTEAAAAISVEVPATPAP